jgi:hypothetical protein
MARLLAGSICGTEARKWLVERIGNLKEEKVGQRRPTELGAT